MILLLFAYMSLCQSDYDYYADDVGDYEQQLIDDGYSEDSIDDYKQKYPEDFEEEYIPPIEDWFVKDPECRVAKPICINVSPRILEKMQSECKIEKRPEIKDWFVK